MKANSALETVVDRVADLLHRRIGLRPDTTLRGRLVRAVRDEATYQGQDPAAYADGLLEDEAVLQRLLNRVTVQETGFFRHPEQFDALISEVIPGLEPPVRIWSAGCANGQEAFSLAILLEERGIEGSVIATDISTAALDRTREARYTGRELSGLSPERLERHFTPRGDRWEVNQSVRDRVTTLHHNILDPIPPEVMSCEVVLCRNVLIYLSAEQIRVFMDRVADALPPTVTFLVGAAETLWQASDRFTATDAGETYIYRRHSTGAAATRRVARPDMSGPPVGSTTTRRVAAPPRKTSTRPSLRSDRKAATTEPRAGETADALEKTAQDAIATGDYSAAVVAFRKCAYLRPHDPVAQLHLGLALEASGDRASAQRAFAVARRSLLEAGPEASAARLEGYAASELLKLLESKR